MRLGVVNKYVRLVLTRQHIPRPTRIRHLDEILILQHFSEHKACHEVLSAISARCKHVIYARETRAHSFGPILGNSICPADISPILITSHLVGVIPALDRLRGLTIEQGGIVRNEPAGSVVESSLVSEVQLRIVQQSLIPAIQNRPNARGRISVPLISRR